jgi:hypothetical protein
MAARRDRSGLTAKESKIVSKKSRLFDSKTQGIGLPQKSSKATITGRKPGKPKPTAGKGMNKNVVTKSGKAGRAIENKMRSAMSLPKLQTTGKAKAASRNAKVKDFGVNITKGKNKNWAKEANKTTLPGAATSRRSSVKESNFNSRMEKHPLVRNAGEQASEKKYRENRGKPVPVKPKGRRGLRGGGMLGGGGLRTYNK